MIFKERRDRKIQEVAPVYNRNRSASKSGTRVASPTEAGNRLYQAAKDSNEYKSQLKDWYGRQEDIKNAKDHTFQPKLNENRHKLSEKKKEKQAAREIEEQKAVN